MIAPQTDEQLLKLRTFWSIENSQSTKLSSRENDLILFFRKIMYRDDEGHLVVKLLFDSSSKPLGNSRNLALSRF